jgi:hypothetical protein
MSWPRWGDGQSRSLEPWLRRLAATRSFTATLHRVRQMTLAGVGHPSCQLEPSHVEIPVTCGNAVGLGHFTSGEACLLV